ncbi:bestrophin-1-like [Dermacentor silvarum]|uniref:bestrophin-1-like n=1 Tax=Dermacentor silvarum TaxID=543639 RepID=UPI0021009AB7|nr:bestrophin-1-like [Dermacentor silvarum]
MTIAYQADVSTSTLLGFWKLVARWRGSVYKLIYKEMLVYGAAFTAIAIWYRRFMTADQRRLFEQLALYSDRALEHIPLSFVLGFYVSFVAGRWWDQFTSIPWPDRLAHVVLAYVSGGDEQGRLLRRTMMRYANLGLVLVLKSVVTLTTHLFFVTCLVARQSLDPEKGYPGHQLDVYFPFFTFLQFIFFMGWLKVAEQLINPFGEDDDDFETNWLIDRHTQVSYMAVDEMYGKFPPMERDLHWDSQEPDLPYTAAAIVHKIPTYRGSAVNIG